MSRKGTRAKLAELFTAAMPTATVWKYRKADPKGVTPLIMVCSGGTNRKSMTLRGTFPDYAIRIYSLVLHSEEGGSWNEELAEDLLDDQEQSIADVLSTNKKVTGYWDALEYESTSEAERVVLAGVPYLLEVIQILVHEMR